tara:strand:- start:88 stop:1095 length:1008 start_codon:yes stop_codon:yes gene_type:complete
MFNAEKYIQRCLSSIINQNIPADHYEILVMNDGSTDQSSQIVEQFRLQYQNVFLFTDINEGPDAKRNKGLDIAKGKYIYFVDADDYLAHNTLGPLLDLAVEKKLQVLGFKALFTEEERFFTVAEDLPRPDDMDITTGESFLESHRDVRFEIWWYLINREYLNKVGARFDKDNYCSDVMFTLKLFLNAERMVFYPVHIYRYYQSQNSLTRDKREPTYLTRMIRDFKATIIELSQLITECEEERKLSKILLENLKYRRDYLVFFIIPLMLRANYNYERIQENLSVFRKENAYPIKDFLGKEYSGMKYKSLNFIFNHSILLKPLIFVFRYSKHRRFVT